MEKSTGLKVSMIRKYRNQTHIPQTHSAVRKSHITCTVTKRLLSPVPQSWRPCRDYKNDNRLSPYLTGLRLCCDSWRQTSRVGRKTVLKQSPVIRNSLAYVAKWRKVVAKILNMFKNFMRQNSSQNSRQGVLNPSRTCRRPLAI